MSTLNTSAWTSSRRCCENTAKSLSRSVRPWRCSRISTICAAARAAARGGSSADVQAAVKSVLGAKLIDHACILLIYPNCPASQQPVVVVSTDGDGCCVPPDIDGAVTKGCKSTGQPVSAKVAVPAKYMVPSVLLRAVTRFDSLCLSRQSTMILE